MLRPRSLVVRSTRALALATVLLASAIGPSGCGETRSSDEVTVDSTLVDVLVDLYLADARGSETDDPAYGDSLRDLVYETHGLDSTTLNQRLSENALRVGAVAALTEAVETQLTTERSTLSPRP